METTVKENAQYRALTNVNRGGRTLTFFTPTYNRVGLLQRIYECLKGQTNKNFVWILVNDGSTDNTDEVAMSLLEKEDVAMMYIKKDNGGKHSAFKVALEHCQTEFFQCLDDDDIYAENSVDFFLGKWEEVRKEGKDDIGAIRTLTKRKNGSYICNFNVESELGREYDASTLETNYVMGRTQENWTCYDTQKLKTVDLFPSGYWMSEHQKFYSEGLWQSRFARKYKCRYVNIALRTWTTDATTSLTRARKNRQHYLDMFLNSKMAIDEQLDYMRSRPGQLVKSVIMVNLLRNYLGVSMKDLLTHTSSSYLRMLYLCTSPLSLFGKMIIERKINK